MKKIISYLVPILFISIFSLSSCKEKKDVENNALVGTEWNDNTGMLLLYFTSSTRVKVTYNIPLANHSFPFEVAYSLKGNILKIDDCKMPYKGKEFYLVKNFEGELKGSEITARFLTMKGHPSPKDDPEENLETKNIRLKKR